MASRYLTKTLLASFLLLPLVTAADNKACYYPSGDKNDHDFPCADTEGHVMCCPLGWQCMTNGLCFNPNDKNSIPSYQRDTCTDKTFKDPACPDICTYNGDEGHSGNEFMRQCSDGKWCCDREQKTGDCCEKESVSYLGHFDLPEPQPFATITGDGEVNAVATQLSNRDYPTSIVKATGAFNPSATTGGTPSNAHSQSSGGTTGGAESSSPTDAASQPGKVNKGSSNTGVIVGAVVGGIAALALVVIAMLLFLRRNKQRKQPAELDANKDEIYRKEAPIDAEKGFGGSMKPSELDSSTALVRPPPQTSPVEIDGHEHRIFTELDGTPHIEPVELDAAPSPKLSPSPSPRPDSSPRMHLAPGTAFSDRGQPSPITPGNAGDTLPSSYAPSPMSTFGPNGMATHSASSSKSSIGNDSLSFYSPDSVSASVRSSVDGTHLNQAAGNEAGTLSAVAEETPSAVATPANERPKGKSPFIPYQAS